MADVAQTLDGFGPKHGATELVNWGGWWRNRYREDARKAQRVLAELRCMVREGHIHRNPGAAAHDLWKRFAPSEGQQAHEM
jgi:hypothetical protein